MTTATGEQRKVEIGNALSTHRRRREARRRAPIDEHGRPPRRQGAGRDHAPPNMTRLGAGDSHPRRQLAQPEQRADLDRRRRARSTPARSAPSVGGTNFSVSQHALARGDRGHRDREGSVGGDALRHRRGERRHRRHDEEGTRRHHALEVVRARAARQRPQRLSGDRTRSGATPRRRRRRRCAASSRR